MMNDQEIIIQEEQNLKLIKALPKVELHAHLNGSLSNKAFEKLYKLKYNTDDASEDFQNHSELYQILSKNSLTLSDCFKKFKFAHDLTDRPATLAVATEQVIKDFNDDNLMYLELRTTPRATEQMTKDEYISSVCDTILKCQHSYPDIMVKLILSIDRSQGLKAAEENLEAILKAMVIYPQLIKGIDLSGDPYSGEFNIFKNVLTIAKKNGLKLALHCGEIANNSLEILDMLEFGMDRIGHGTFISDSEKAWDLLIKEQIPVECCLTSNVKCGTVPSYDDHHFKKLFDIDHPIIICTDDFGVFNTTLSEELNICAETYNLTFENIVKITENSILYSFASNDEKRLLQTKLRQWQNT